MWYLLADTWSKIFDSWSATFSNQSVRNAAESIAAYVAGAGALVALIGWVWKKILLPLGRAASNVSDMYSTHEYMLTEVTKIKDAVVLIQQVADNCRQNGEELRELVRQSTMAAEASIIKTRLLYEDSPNAYFECNMSGKCVWTNKALQQLFVMSADEMLGDGWMMRIHPDDITKTAHQWRDTIEDWVPYVARYRLIHPVTGDETLVESTAEILHDFKNVPVCVWGKVTKKVMRKTKTDHSA